MFVPPAALALALVPALTPHHKAQAQVEPAFVLAAVATAEAQRRAATTPQPVPEGAAASLDKLAGAAARIDPGRLDANLAANAIAR